MKAACQVNVGVNNAVASVAFVVVAVAAIASVVAAAFGVVVVVSAVAIGAVAATVDAALLRFKSVPWLLST